MKFRKLFYQYLFQKKKEIQVSDLKRNNTFFLEHVLLISKKHHLGI